MAQLPKTKDSILELKDGWLTIWFNRPETRNALSSDLVIDIKNSLVAVSDDRSVRGIIFRGKSGIFCSGIDLNEIKTIVSDADQSYSKSYKMSMELGDLFRMISKTPQITVAAVEGAAMAGAFGIICACDFLVSFTDAKFALTETRIGLTPAQIAPYVLNRLGFIQARKMMLLGSHIDGKEAFKIGMADHIVNSEKQLIEYLLDIKDQVKKCGPNAMAKTKEIISDNYIDNSKRAAEYFASCIIHEEGRDGFASFFEKRKPFWEIED